MTQARTKARAIMGPRYDVESLLGHAISKLKNRISSADAGTLA